MPTLSWVAGPQWTDERPDPPATPELLVMASRLELRSFRDFVPFLRASLALRRQCRSATGNVGHALAVDILANRFWTLSTWRDRSDLDDYVQQEPHRTTMHRFHPAMRASVFTFFPAMTGRMPVTWAQARQILATEEHRRADDGAGTAPGGHPGDTP